jgi:hypothetical protein
LGLVGGDAGCAESSDAGAGAVGAVMLVGDGDDGPEPLTTRLKPLTSSRGPREPFRDGEVGEAGTEAKSKGDSGVADLSDSRLISLGTSGRM